MYKIGLFRGMSICIWLLEWLTEGGGVVKGWEGGRDFRGVRREVRKCFSK